MATADDGLAKLGVDEAERRSSLDIIRARLDSGITPARWQRQALKRIDNKDRPQAQAQMVEEYLAMAATGRPVSEWE